MLSSPGYVTGNILDTNNPITTSGTVYRDGPIHLASTISPPSSSGSSKVVMQSSYEIDLLGGFQTVNGADITFSTQPLTSINGTNLNITPTPFSPCPSNAVLYIAGQTQLTTATTADLYAGNYFQDVYPPSSTICTWNIYNASNSGGNVLVYQNLTGQNISFNVNPGTTYYVTLSYTINGVQCPATTPVYLYDQIP